MSTALEIDLDLSTDLEPELDTTPQCEYLGRTSQVFGMFSRVVTDQCEKPADYIIFCWCAKADAFVCQEHLNWVKNTDKIFGLVSLPRKLVFSCGHIPNFNECRVVPLR